MTDLIMPPNSVRLMRDGVCPRIRTPGLMRAPDRLAARPLARHPEQGWSLLCNGVVLFDDGGQLLPDGRAVFPAVAHAAAA